MMVPYAARTAAAVALATCAAVVGCRHSPPPQPQAVPETARPGGGSATVLSNARPTRAQANIAPLGAASIYGTLMLVQLDDGVQIVGALYNLPPNSSHGFHVHEKGDCSSVDGKSAGGHFNPGDVSHGDIGHKHAHAGDLGNLTSDAQGTVKVDIIKPHVSLDDKDTTFIGRAFIIHESPDDLETQPTGNAGDRIGCGVIVTQ